jgi:hypothetical protein
MALKPLQVRPYAMAMILVRLPKATKCLATAAPRTDQALPMDCDRCPCADHAAIKTMQQQDRNILFLGVADRWYVEGGKYGKLGACAVYHCVSLNSDPANKNKNAAKSLT